MKYRYEAKTKQGELQVGFVEAGSPDTAASLLTGHDLFILRLETAEHLRWVDRIAQFFSRVRLKDMVVFSRQLATLLEAQLPLGRSLKILSEQTTNPILKEAAEQVSADIDAGLSFSQALERQGNIFPAFFVSMVRSAEITGNLERVIGFLADYMEKEAALATRARSALIYPAIVIALFVVVAGIMVGFVFPQIGPVFVQSGVELPLVTRILLTAGALIGRWWFLFLIAMVAGIIGVVNYIQTAEGKAFLDDAKVRLPFLRKIFLPLTISRFTHVSSLLLKGGIPLAQTMEIAGETLENAIYLDLLKDVSQGVREGKLLSETIARYPEYFPVLIPNMLSVGEAAGRLDDMFDRLTGFYSREADAVINNLVDLIQPILMAGVGILTGLLFASILIPLYQLTTSIR